MSFRRIFGVLAGNSIHSVPYLHIENSIYMFKYGNVYVRYDYLCLVEKYIKSKHKNKENIFQAERLLLMQKYK
jgi:hypothetical protein